MFNRLAGPFREFGLFPGSVYALNRILQRLSPNIGFLFHDWMVQPITNTPLLPEHFASAYEIREIKQGDPLIDSMPVRPEIMVSRFNQNAMCLGTFHKDKLVGYIWFSFDSYEEDEARCTFMLIPRDRAVFDFDLYVYPEFRMGLGFIAVWDSANRYLYQRGIRYSYSRLTRFNRGSARAHDHLGWKRIGSAIILKLWTLELMFTSMYPGIFLSLNESRKASIKLTPDVLQA